MGLELGLYLAGAGVLGLGLFAIFKWGNISAFREVEAEEKENAQAQVDQTRKPLATDDDWEQSARDNLRRSQGDD